MRRLFGTRPSAMSRMAVWLRRALWLPLLLAAYLLTAASWAWLNADALLKQVSAESRTLLTERQTAILLRVEDPNFLTHSGLSVAKGQGLATISSALARDLFLYGERLDGAAGALQSLYRVVFNCCKRIDLGRDVMALVVDAKLSKAQQLALYAGSVYMGTHDGAQVQGLPDAALRYVDKPLAQLNEQEFIGLVAMIKAPNQYHPSKAPVEHARRAARIAALVAGQCQPDGWLDTSFDSCER
ncbi:transglycosylase domain-containing protein [Massilia sp. YIM B02443]|uniref:transglycosylase domain-containing protein n=1 Tax=Massilia sp. YIM B02443 TaxID=3050127 RepID=UPI0025B6EA5C|nr:transglycosylase domain-containing protein [Massilia sp. YIM B02443]MDN4037920.1 transglycosylase domain-containing protein [Massilia sp. YIM B02443]